jgi:SAM-dependent methyltransferase
VDPLFWEVHSGLAHEAPGSRADTLRALALTGLSGALAVLDAGSGPGAASLTLMEALPEAEVTAVDLHPPFLAEAEERARAAGFAGRFRTRAGDMARLPFAPGSFDLVWSEGAAYTVGLGRALAAWAPLLRAGGRIAFSEAVWLTPAPHPRARALFAGHPGMTDADGVRRAIGAAGLRPLGDFLLSREGWEAYYIPLAGRVEALAMRHGVDHPVLAEHLEEIAVWREHGADYGYGFFVAG